MGLPGARIKKLSTNAGTVLANPAKTLAIVAPCSGGGSAVTNLATAWNGPAAFQQTYLAGPLVELGAYELLVPELPIVAVKPTTSTAGAYGALTKVGTGNFAPAVGSAAAIADDYNCVFNAQLGSTMAGPIPQALAGNVAGYLFYCTAGGALGAAGIQYVESFDGGNSCSAVKSLGTSLTLSPTEPQTNADSGIRITLGSAAATIATGDYFWVTTVGPRMQSSDLTAALQALFVTKNPFDLVLVHGETAQGIVSLIETWVLSMNVTGRYPTVVVNTRFKGQLPGAVETETAYASAITTVLTPCVGLDVCAGVDGGAVVSSLTGINKAQPTSLAIASVCEANDIGTDPAEEDLGAVTGFDIDNANNSPSFHDEAVTNTLDPDGGTLRASTLRSWFGEDGAFVTNAYLLSEPGSDFVYIQDNRVINAACVAANNQLKKLCSKGVVRDLSTGFISPAVADAWDQLITSVINTATKGQVSGLKFEVARADPLTGNGPQTINASLDCDALVYPKNFAVTAAFVTTLS